jgi:hypothetical protein
VRFNSSHLYSVLRAIVVAAAAFIVTRCGGSPSGPGDQAPSVVSITPNEGPLIGGTAVHVTGTNFAPAAVLTIGGVPATDVVVESLTSIAAKTGPAPAGTADVSVAVGGRKGTLPGGFRYLAVSGSAPVIGSIVARGSRPGQPAGFADTGEEITVTATVDDPDTPFDRLSYQWSADTGTFSESGAVVKWRAPADAQTPATITLNLTLADNTGNSTSGSTTVVVHNSVKEVGDLAREFLLDFSDSNKSAAFVVRNFSKSPRCEPGRDEEFDDVDRNRRDFHIDSSEIRSAAVNFQFGGFPCSYAPQAGDACAAVPSAWESTCNAGATNCKPGEKSTVRGVDYVTASYEGNQWRLCASYFSGEGSLRSSFIR